MVYGTYAFNGQNTYDNSSFEAGAGTVSCPIYIPTGRQLANGAVPLQIVDVHPFWSGRGAARNAHLEIGPYGTGTFALPAGSSGTQLGLGLVGYYGAGYQTLAMTADGPHNFGRKAGVSGINISDSSGGWANSTIGGYFSYNVAPAAPSVPTVALTPGGKAHVTFSGSGDTGGTGITGWLLQYATNSSFSGATTVASSGTSDLSLTPGVQYWFRAAGRNAVSDAYGSSGPWGPVATAIMLGSGGKIKTGATTWKPINSKIKTSGGWKSMSSKIKTAASTWKTIK